MKRVRFHRVVFLLAGIYNIGWGLYSVLDPQWFFRFSGMEPLNHPHVFMCLAMVIGLYGILYLEIARAPSKGWMIAVVGLLGKVLGPVGMVLLITQGTWPAKALWLCVTNDLIWLIPFGLYLRDAWPPKSHSGD